MQPMSAQRDWPDRETVELALQLIRRDGETQSRSRLNQEVIREYADLLLDGVELPPIQLCSMARTTGLPMVFIGSRRQSGLEKQR